MKAEYDTSLNTINLGGMMVGNGCTDWNVDTNPALPQTLFNFNIIPQRLLDEMEENDCKYYGDPTFPHAKNSRECNITWAKIQKLMLKLNIYDLYRHNYNLDTLERSDKVRAEGRIGTTVIGGEVREYLRGYTMSEYTPWAANLVQDRENEVILGDYIADYMNREDVREAFNIPEGVQTWSECTRSIDYHELDECSYWIYPILKDKYRMMKYSGDTDGAVPTYGTKQWIQNLGWDITEEWRPWFTNGQVSGYVEKYDGLDFVTVKGVGHMAPQWARQPVQEMITAWAHNESF